MNGMKAKKVRRAQQQKFTENGLPRDAKDWTVEDWSDLHHGMQAIFQKISARHKPKGEPIIQPERVRPP